GVGLNLLVLIAGTLVLFLNPVPTAAHAAIAGPWGWAALALALGSVAAWAAHSGCPVAPDGVGLGLLVAADFLALGLVFVDTGNWLTYHGLLAGQALAGAMLVLGAWQASGLRVEAVAEDVRAAVVRWSTVAL